MSLDPEFTAPSPLWALVGVGGDTSPPSASTSSTRAQASPSLPAPLRPLHHPPHDRPLPPGPRSRRRPHTRRPGNPRRSPPPALQPPGRPRRPHFRRRPRRPNRSHRRRAPLRRDRGRRRAPRRNRPGRRPPRRPPHRPRRRTRRRHRRHHRRPGPRLPRLPLRHPPLPLRRPALHRLPDDGDLFGLRLPATPPNRPNRPRPLRGNGHDNPNPSSLPHPPPTDQRRRNRRSSTVPNDGSIHSATFSGAGFL